MTYAAFFARADEEGRPPFPYQARLATEPWPTLLDVPTGLGKTAAIVVAWLYRRATRDPDTPARLIYCLPMRSLVEQTAREAAGFVERCRGDLVARGVDAPGVHILMGGAVAQGWDTAPEASAILVGTQDQLLSRALNRGYGASRFRWPMEFAALHNDALWVFDEPQLMGVGVETGAQLEGLRRGMGAFGPTRSLWSSATLDRGQLDTVDHPRPATGWTSLTLNSADRDMPVVCKRLGAAKALVPLAAVRIEGKKPEAAAPAIAAATLAAHRPGTLTLVVVNRVARAQAIYEALLAGGRAASATGLIHSRFCGPDRARSMTLLLGAGDRIVVATQAVEAGVDVSAATLITELAPWPSLVQRLGRCNREGELTDARVFWIEVDETDADASLPYAGEELALARGLLTQAVAAGGAGPAILSTLPYSPPAAVRPVLRRRDLLDLFDTTPDIAGFDLDVSRFIRDDADTDVQVFWRSLPEVPPPPDTPAPTADELCRVAIGSMAGFLQKLDAARGRDEPAAERLHAYRFDALAGVWRPEGRPRPGQVLLIDARAGGYAPDLGFTGEPAKDGAPLWTLPPGEGVTPPTAPEEGVGDDPGSRTGVWVELGAHLTHVRDMALALVCAVPVGPYAAAVVDAAAFHDVGKAHPVFQEMLTQGQPPTSGAQMYWAKSSNKQGRASRRGFRHELASALAWLQTAQQDHPARDLVAYLVAAHHGKVRLSIRALPGETEPPEAQRRFARGVWDGDPLPAGEACPISLVGGDTLAPLTLDLEPMGLGVASWTERVLALIDHRDLGPFRLAWLETLVRVADWRASRDEQLGGAQP